MLQIKRIYEKPEKSDGFRVLVDRLWPRGVSKVNAALDEWAKDVAPTPELRTWFNHDPAKFDEFKRKYLAELQGNPAVQDLVTKITGHPTVTLLYGAHDQVDNQAVVLRDYLATLGVK